MKIHFPVSLLNIETIFFNIIMQLINPKYAWKNRFKQMNTTQEIVAMV